MSNIKEIETVWIRLPDGISLAARVWMPLDAESKPYPSILEYIPYRRRDFTRKRDDALHSKFAEAGYVSVRVDIRGSGDSQGIMADEYTNQEITDGYDVIEWLAKQPWCNGSVGMMGKSWGAYNSLQVAALNPPSLKAILPVMGTDDRWKEDIHFRNGLMATDNFWWGSIMQLMNTSPPDPEIVGDNWREIWLKRLDSMELWTKNWASHQTNDKMWKRGSISRNYESIKVPVYYVSGWNDLFRDTPFRLAQNLKCPLKILVGPWAHLYPHEAVPKPAIDFIGEAIKWWDFWLKGKNNGVMDDSSLIFYEMEHMHSEPSIEFRKGRWITEGELPNPNISSKKYFLNSGSLSDNAHMSDKKMEITSPQNYGMSSGDITSFGLAGDIPLDCRADEGGALTFRSEILEEDLNILGQANLKVCVIADKEQAFISAILVDESPDGDQALITRGFFNLTHRDSDVHPKAVILNKEMRIEILMQGVSWKLAKGHKLLLHLGSTYWPVIWPSPEPVKLTFKEGTSILNLPIRINSRKQDSHINFKDPKSQVNKTYKTIEAGSIERDYNIDMTTGLVTQRVYIDGGVFGPVGKIYFKETDTEFHDKSERTYSIHPNDPLTAEAEMKQSRSIRKGKLKIKLETYSHQKSTKTHFILSAWCKCWENGKLFHSVDWDYKVPRKGM